MISLCLSVFLCRRRSNGCRFILTGIRSCGVKFGWKNNDFQIPLYPVPVSYCELISSREKYKKIPSFRSKVRQTPRSKTILLFALPAGPIHLLVSVPMRTSGRPPDLLANVCTIVAFGASTRTESHSLQNHSQRPPRQKPAPRRPLSSRARRPRGDDSQRSPTRAAVAASARGRPQRLPVRHRGETANAVSLASL